MEQDNTQYQIINCKPLADYHVWVQFGDGIQGIADLSDLIKLSAFSKAWKTIDHFNQLRIDPKTETITWREKGHEVDIAPTSLRRRALQSSP